MVPHGMSVALTAPEAFRFTFEASPQRHIQAAQLLAPGAGQPANAAEFLPSVLIDLMRDIEIPNGVAAVGFTSADIPSLVEGTMKHRHPELAGDRRPILAHEGRYEAAPLRAGDAQPSAPPPAGRSAHQHPHARSHPHQHHPAP